MSQFLTFLCNFLAILIDLIDLNAENAQQRTDSFSSRLFRRDYSCFLNEKDLKLAPKTTKKPKIFQFSKFLCIFLKVLTDFVDSKVQKGERRKVLVVQCPFMKRIAVFILKNVPS